MRLLLPFWLFLLNLLCLPLFAADTVTLVWDASSTTNIAGYRIYYGTVTTNPAAGNYVFLTNVVPGVTTVSIPNVAAGIAYFQATAFIVGGMESYPSNTATYTNRNYGPINLRITSSTNNTAAIWVDKTSSSMQVQWSGDLQNWRGWAALQSLDPYAPVGNAVFLSGILPDGALYWRAVDLVSVSTTTITPLPTGQRVSGLPPIPVR